MKFFAVCFMIFIVFSVVTVVYRRLLLKNFYYKCSFNKTEVFEGEEIEFTETVTNNKFLPVPWLKSELTTSEFLEFSELQSTVTDKTRLVTSFFSLSGFSKISRTWKIKCSRRGIYEISRVVITASDILGYVKKSFFEDISCFENIRVKVLPLPADENCISVDQSEVSGNFFSVPKLISDPFFINGVRDYTPCDGIRNINWYASAREQKLMVSKNDYTSDMSATVFLNIQTSPADRDMAVYTDRTEKCIRVCAAIINKCSDLGIAVRLLCNNGEPGTVLDVVSEDKFSLFREMAAIDYRISIPFDQMLSCTIPEIYNSRIIVVSAFRSEIFEIIKNERSEVFFVVPDGGEAV